tara:strand:- start:180 stop:548 length:369 start_codon:yes stop_codon:yes gene_type:complete
MYKISTVLLLGLSILNTSGCGSDAVAESYTDDSEAISVSANENVISIPFEVEAGIQSEVLHQKIEVINDNEAYNDFLLSISSMSGAVPIFDEETETMVGIISNIQGCSFTPLLWMSSNLMAR